jgi:CHRD domain-containing protein
VTGVITAADVLDASGPPNQGIRPGEIGELITAVRRGLTYVNVHSTTFGQGEIRGQIGGGREDDDD